MANKEDFGYTYYSTPMKKTKKEKLWEVGWLMS